MGVPPFRAASSGTVMRLCRLGTLMGRPSPARVDVERLDIMAEGPRHDYCGGGGGFLRGAEKLELIAATCQWEGVPSGRICGSMPHPTRGAGVEDVSRRDGVDLPER